MNEQNADKIADGQVVSIHYTLKLDSGEEIDSSRDREALTYLHGSQNIVTGLEKELTGCTVGEKLDVKVAPEEGYGPRLDEAMQEVPIAEMPKDVEAGMQLQAETANGQALIVHVKEVREDVVLIDLNHPLAGETLNFSVEVVELRAATAEELEHGHPHGPGGHHH